MTDHRISYCGRIVYVGIDVHKDTYTVTCVCNKQIVKTATVQADPAALAASLPRWFPGATLYSVYEAGFSAFVLHRALTKAGITNIILESGEFCAWPKLNTRGYPCTLGVPTASVLQKGYPLAQAHCTAFTSPPVVFMCFA